MDEIVLVATPDGRRWRTDSGRVWLTVTARGYQLHVDGVDLGPFTNQASAIKAAELMVNLDRESR